MIHRVKFANFKCLGELELEDLGEFSVFVGPNGSGKTSILEGLHYISQLGTKRPSEVFENERDPSTLLQRGSEPRNIEIEVEGTWGGHRGELDLRVEVDQVSGNPPDGGFKFGWKFENGREYSQSGAADRHLACREETRDLGHAVHSAVFLRLNPEKLAAPSYSDAQVPRVEYDGEGLATVLREMQTTRPEAFSELVAHLSDIVPVVEGLRTRRAEVWKTKTEEITVNGETTTHETSEKFMGEEVVFDMEGAEGIPAHAVSEGTLLVLGLLAVIISERRPKLLLLDDIEQSLHPKAIEDLVAALRELLEEFSDLQILATSHSPYLLDYFDGDEVWLTNLDDEGSTVARRLSEHPDYDEWSGEMAAGEFWSYVGEDWLLDADDE